MSERDAREEWDPEQRRTARTLSLAVGVCLTLLGSVGGTAVVVVGVIGGKDIPLVSIAFLAAIVFAGIVCLIPNVAVPIAYRLIDKWGKDTEGPAYKPEP